MSAQCWWIVAVLLAVVCAQKNIISPTCDSQIYCQGRLLETIQMNYIYDDDSKTFVDKKLKYSPRETLQHFDELMAATRNNASYEQLKTFANAHFEEENELEVSHPPDWVEFPLMLKRISDPDLRQWAQELNALWKDLTRKVSNKVKLDSDKYSLIYVPNRFVVPGGRFREQYYWDTYWIVRGLLLTNMTDTVKGILENFLYLIKAYGHIPNGGRVYYLKRSHPPLLIPMVENYYQDTKDLEFLRNNIETLEKELNFWMVHRTVQVSKSGKNYTLARYYAVSKGPRPESYREDFRDAINNFNNDARRQEFYVDIKSGAESGWDFSSRWFIKNGTNGGNLSDIHTRHIIPVDLNAFIYLNAHTLSKFYALLGNISKSEEYAKLASKWMEAVTAVLWNEHEGSWFDYDIINNIPRKYFYPSNLAPLWTKCYDERNVASVAQKVVNYIERNNLRFFAGGIPTSTEVTSQQWDMPNAWPPLQAIIIQGLEKTQEPNATQLAYKLAKQWVRSNFKGYQRSRMMYEKYNAEFPGMRGKGGEYVAQEGFGWTNGIILELLATYGEKLTVKSSSIIRRPLLEILGPPSVS